MAAPVDISHRYPHVGDQFLATEVVTGVKVPQDGLDPLDVSPEVIYFLQLVNTWGLGQAVTVTGMLTNVINMVVFVKQGLQDTVNISLFGLALSDLGSLLFLHLLNLCFTPAVLTLDLPFYPREVMWHLAWAHIIFTRITTGITGWITLERCLCIASPLKVKLWITSRRTVWFIIILYLTMIGHVLPVFYTTRLTWKFDLTVNKSKLGIVYMDNRNDIEEVVFVINNVIPSAFFVLVTVCTTILVRELKLKSKWRKQTTASTTDNLTSDRDTRVIKMVVFISVVFIFCYSPGVILQIWAIADDELRPDGSHRSALFAYSSFMLHLESINSSVNLFIYVRVSSKFKHTLVKTFCLQRQNKN